MKFIQIYGIILSIINKNGNKMKLLSSNFNKSIQNLDKTVPSLLTLLQKKTSQLWKKVIGEQKAPIKENFVSHIKVAEVKNTEGSEVAFDIMRREFDSQFLRNAIDKNESVFFEDDFISGSDWASSAVKEQESLNSIIIPIIKEFDDIETFLTLSIQEELGGVFSKLNAAEEKAAENILLEQQSHKDALTNLQKEKEEELEIRLNLLKEVFKERERQISNFESLGEQTADQFIRDIGHANARFQDEKISKRAEKIVKRNKEFVSSVVKESSERLNQDFKTESSKIHEEISAKFEEKEKAINQNLKERLQSIRENLLKEKQAISTLSAKQVKSLESEIQSRREKLANQLQNPRLQTRDSQEFHISPETWKEMESVLEKSPISTEVQEDETPEDLFRQFPPNWFNKFQENIKPLEQEESNTDSNETDISQEVSQEMESAPNESPVSTERTEDEEETSEDLFREFPPNWFNKFQENIQALEQEESDTDSKESLEREGDMDSISSSDSLQNLDNHPSVIEAKKLMSDLEKDYEKRMTEVCQLGENRLQAFKKEKGQKILNIENSIQNNLKIAQEKGATRREKAERKLAQIRQAKKNSNRLQSLFKAYQKSRAKNKLKEAEKKEFRIIDVAFEKNHLLRDEGILKIKKETEDLEQQVLQETEAQRKNELSRFRKLQNKIDGLVQTLQTSPWIEEISIL